MDFVITNGSEYVVPDEQRTEGSSRGQQLYVDPTPKVSISGGNARLIHG